jgi:hypothetical protein
MIGEIFRLPRNTATASIVIGRTPDGDWQADRPSGVTMSVGG